MTQAPLDQSRPDGLRTLLDPGLAPIFARPPRLGAESSWYGHLPFASWLLQALRPALLVESGTRSGVSYAGFCDTVASAGLPTRCFAIGDSPSDEAFAELRAFHNARYGAFSRLLRLEADAPSRFADGSIDLLHIAGRHRLGDIARNYESWLPRLSPGAIVLVHPTDGRDQDDGIWRFWSELSARHPAFEFLHGQGLGIVAPGTAPPTALHGLFEIASDPAATAALRARFALLGERWEVESQNRAGQRERQTLSRRAANADRLSDRLLQLEAEQALLQSHAAALADSARDQSATHDRLRDELASSKADRHRLLLEAARLQGAATAAEVARDQTASELATALRGLADAHVAAAQAGHALAARLDQHRQDRDALEAIGAALTRHCKTLELQVTAGQAALETIRSSLSWRLTAPFRAALSRLRDLPEAASPLPILPSAATVETTPPQIPAPEPEAALLQPTPTHDAIEPDHPADIAGWRPIRRILFVAGEPGTPGAVYRTRRNAAACAAGGYEIEIVDVFDVNPDNLAAADLVVLWRAAYSAHIKTLLGLAKAAHTRVVFDVDDLIVKPALAVAEIIDGIRTTFVTEAEGRSYFQGMQHTLTSCDLCTTTTDELAAPMGALHPIVHVLPNSFDADTERASRYAVRLRGERAADGRVRLGYAGGTRTHQKDFATIAGSLAQVLRQRPDTLLVLFRDGSSGEGLVLIEEFPDLLPLASRIEWRDMVPLAALPAELARFDISLCPLEQGNPFCEAKSELKYFESALAGVCLVATPTGPFRRAMQDGVTGLLPANEAAWEQALLSLVDQPERRHRLARAAYHDVLWQFGPRRQAELWTQLLAGLDGGPTGARAAELALRRGPYRAASLPEVPDSTVLFSHDSLGEARVTVGMTSYNYEAYIGEALDSVLAQTLGAIDLVVVDDGSSDGSVALLLDWAASNRLRFNRIRILKTLANAGLGGARNVVFDQAETPWIMVLDSDNRLQPTACERLLAALEAEPLAAFAYPHIRQFGASETVMGEAGFDAFHLASGNYIDAMAMVAKWAWAAAGGYYVRRDAMGWEDFTLWCRLVELGQFGLSVPEELALYRVHSASMVNAITEKDANKRLMVEFVETRHPWLRLRMRDSRQRR